MLTINISKRSALVIAVALVLVVPAVALAGGTFSDVDPGSVHATGIDWVAGAGVTAGCGDGTTYCPDDPVTRAQMGTFMHRLSGNASGIDPSVDAAYLEGYGPDAFVKSTNLQTFSTPIAFGESAILGSNGPLDFFATCTLDDGGNDVLEFFVESSVGGSLWLNSPLTANVPMTVGAYATATTTVFHTLATPAVHLLAADGTSLTSLQYMSVAINAGGYECFVEGAIVASV